MSSSQQERAWFLHHAAEHPSNLPHQGVYRIKVGRGQVAMSFGKEQPILGLKELGVRIGQFTDKMRLISSLPPSLGYIGADRPRGATHLVSQCESFLARPALRLLKYTQTQIKGFLPDDKVNEMPDRRLWLAFGRWLPVAGFWILDPSLWHLASGLWLPI